MPVHITDPDLLSRLVTVEGPDYARPSWRPRPDSQESLEYLLGEVCFSAYHARPEGIQRAKAAGFRVV